MLRPTKLKLVLGVLLVAATYFVCINSHLDIFPCVVTELDDLAGRLVTRDGHCSLMQTQGDYLRAPEHASLSPVGYVVAVGVVGVVPLLVGFVLGTVLRRR